MKKLALALSLMLLSSLTKASPYFYVYPVTKGSQLNLSQGALFVPSFDLSQTQAFTNIAIVYHPLSSGSIIPVEIQPYLPPESWSINIGGGWGTSKTVFGPGVSINLLDSIRAYATTLLRFSSNSTAQGIANQIAPGQGPVSLTVGPQWTFTAMENGNMLPLNQWRLTPHWFVGASFGF